MRYRPNRVVWEMTNACNAKCIHCGSQSGVPRENELSEAEALRVCDELKELGCKHVTLMGGEFFLSPYWEKVCERLLEHEIMIGPLTNGLLLNEKNIQKMRDLGLERVFVSIDGIGKTHDHIRGVPGLFDRLVANIQKAQDAGLQVGANSSFSGLNIAEADAVYDYLVKLGVYVWQIQIVENVGNAFDRRGISVSMDQVYELAKKISKYRRSSEIQVVTADNIGYFCSFEPLIRDEPFTGCKGGRFLLGLQANGDVRGCLSVMCTDKAIEGNVRERSLMDIWHDPNCFAMYRQRTVEKLTGFCAECDYRNLCRAGCTSMAYSMTGNYTENPFCLHRYEVERELQSVSEAELA